MKFILVDDGAASAIISDRVLQSTEFSQGRALAKLLREGVLEQGLGQRFTVISEGEGTYFLSPTSKEHFLVIDLTQCAPFRSHGESEALLIFQRLLRFAVRIWGNLRLSAAEKMIPDSTKAVLFPFPITTQSEYRLTLERSPDERRAAKRGAGNHLLLFRDGTTAGGGPAEEPNVSTFRKALKSYPAAKARVEEAQKSARQAGQEVDRTARPLAVTALDSAVGTAMVGMGYDEWLRQLTEAQRIFVLRGIDGAERIEGPAGSGKTLCLVLKCIQVLRKASSEGAEHHSIFFAHGSATERAIREKFVINDPDGFYERGRHEAPQSVRITTLQEWCGEQLATGISETEYLDRDAMEAKELRLLYVAESLEEVEAEHLETHKPFLSPEFRQFLEAEELWSKAEMVQHEIAIMIKGRADEDLERYQLLPRLKYGLPVQGEADRAYVYLIFTVYQAKLRTTGQFDTDDIVLSAIGQLHTPIWRRRRREEGFNSIFVDETHLFNLNELSVFHYLSRDVAAHPIVFSVDRSQALGDRGSAEEAIDFALTTSVSGERTTSTRIRTIFRCSPEITAVALSITASGATLFTNFDNPLGDATSTFTHEEESKSTIPVFRQLASDRQMISQALTSAARMARDLRCAKSDVVIIAFSPILFEELTAAAARMNKPVEPLKERGDLEVVKRAKETGRFVLSLADYVGGLEFQGAVLVGVDDGRVPPAGAATTRESRHFLTYAYHNRLYVAVTRARYRLEFLGTVDRGPSPILESALRNGLVELEE
jgi:hypothetical protein